MRSFGGPLSRFLGMSVGVSSRGGSSVSGELLGIFKDVAELESLFCVLVIICCEDGLENALWLI